MILSINFGHDASLALFDKKLVQFEELERKSRLKHQLGVTSYEIERFLKNQDLKLENISLVTICSTQLWAMLHTNDIEIHLNNLPKKLEKYFPDYNYIRRGFSGINIGGSYYKNHLKKLNITKGTPSYAFKELNFKYIRDLNPPEKDFIKYFNNLISLDLGTIKKNQLEFFIPGIIKIKNFSFPTLYVEHHFCHANYALYYSPNINSLVCTHDGGLPQAPFNSGGVYLTNKYGVLPIVDHRMFLGYIYDKIADFANVYEPGKLMGLASYAIPNRDIKNILNKIIIEMKESLQINEALDNFVSDIIEISLKEKNIIKDLKNKFIFSEKITDEGIQAAANVQFIVENFFINNIGAFVSKIEGLEKSFNTLNLTGGFALNCPTNSALSKKYKNLFINPLPACGDSGISIGAGVAAMLAFDHEIERDKNKNLSAAFPPLKIDTKFSNEDYEIFDLTKYEYNGKIEEFLAEMLIKEKILCLFRGRSEVGPRALGRRSIIAIATSEKIRDKINKAKGRELWRPLAPICRMEDYNDYFDGDALNSQFMLFTNKVKNSVLQGVTHVDDTARVQSITEQDFWIYNCLSIMKIKKEVPVIINTSFNCAGEPIVETIQDAFRSFSKMNFDYLVTDNGIFRKRSVK